MALLRRERSSLLAFVLLLLAAFVVANLVFNLENLAIGPETFPVFEGGAGGENPGDPGFSLGNFNLFLQYLPIVLIILFVVGFLYLRRRGRGKAVLVELVGFSLAIGFIFFFFLLGDLFGNTSAGELDPDSAVLAENPPTPLLGIPVAPSGLAIVGIAVLVVFLSILLSRKFARERLPDAGADKETRALDRIRDTIYRLELGEDVRATVLRCYSDMATLFRRTGLVVGGPVTARELEAQALEELGLSTRSSVELRQLFEEARYSMHELPASYKEGALRCLTAVKGELEARASL
ncbi:MAG: hypothetical protein ACE5EW_04205 [Thermoplasmata archaeon]